jgi:hypothetical protein
MVGKETKKNPKSERGKATKTRNMCGAVGGYGRYKKGENVLEVSPFM